MEYERLIEFYPRAGYRVVQIPKLDVKERVKFVIEEVD